MDPTEGHFGNGNYGNGELSADSNQLNVQEFSSRHAINPRLTGGGGGAFDAPSRIFAIAQKRTALSA